MGNARPIILFDVLRRYFEYRGYDVTFVQNFTDVDDKIIKRANEEGITSQEVAEKYIQEYFTDAQGLGVRPATIHPKATENMQQIIDMVQTLIDKGYAYPVENGDVYYRTLKFKGYGKLSKKNLEDLEAGKRIAVEDQKEDEMDFVLWKPKKSAHRGSQSGAPYRRGRREGKSLDFALWKAAKPGEPAWDSPWGPGRPGWHIECSAMSNRYLGKTIDIHCGGEDLQFPHHENEIAQSEAANGCEFVHYWMHNGFLNIDNRKMSKSLGNFFTVREAAEAYGYETIRLFMLSAHYRSPLNYSADILHQAQNSLDRLYSAEDHLKYLAANGAEGDKNAAEAALADTFDSYRQRFDEAMDDDFNTANAISVLFELVRAINIATADENQPTKAGAQACLDMVHEFTDVLGLLYSRKEESLDEKVEQMIADRQAARAAKNWAEADRIRDELKAMGIELKDTKQGVQWKKI